MGLYGSGYNTPLVLIFAFFPAKYSKIFLKMRANWLKESTSGQSHLLINKVSLELECLKYYAIHFGMLAEDACSLIQS